MDSMEKLGSIVDYLVAETERLRSDEVDEEVLSYRDIAEVA